MKLVAVPLVLLTATLAVAQWTAAGLCGTYTMTTGFEVWELDLRKDSTLTYSWSPDHPGGHTYPGVWKFDGEVVTVRITPTKGKRKTGMVWKLVPVTWGERQYLVFEEGVRDFAGEALTWKDSHLDARSQESERYRAPFMRGMDRKMKRRFGNPKAPGKYAAWFDWR